MRRIIPARAGFTFPGSPGKTGGKDHPRSRGVYNSALKRNLTRVGSSPLARGLQRRLQGGHDHGRIIPARAGFTSPYSCSSRSHWDHPRSRGVYIMRSSLNGSSYGSSPLARGLRAACAPRPRRGRIIPARAGFTAFSRSSASPCSDHPRSRGVYGLFSSSRGGAAGSSPLARGLPPARRARGGRRGIIPARAGFT